MGAAVLVTTVMLVDATLVTVMLLVAVVLVPPVLVGAGVLVEVPVLGAVVVGTAMLLVEAILGPVVLLVAVVLLPVVMVDALVLVEMLLLWAVVLVPAVPLLGQGSPFREGQAHRVIVLHGAHLLNNIRLRKRLVLLPKLFLQDLLVDHLLALLLLALLRYVGGRLDVLGLRQLHDPIGLCSLALF